MSPGSSSPWKFVLLSGSEVLQQRIPLHPSLWIHHERGHSRRARGSWNWPIKSGDILLIGIGGGVVGHGGRGRPEVGGEVYRGEE